MNQGKKTDWKRNVNVPNSLSLLRILVIAPFIYFFIRDEYIWAAVMLIVSGLSDMFDGAIARRFNQHTRLGELLDPLADKLTQGTVVICLGIKFPVVIPLVAILLFKELLMLTAGVVMIRIHKSPPAAKWYGKVGTIVFYLAVILIVALKAIWGYENMAITVTLLAITVAFMIFALIKYFLLFLSILKETPEAEEGKKAESSSGRE